MPAHKETLQGKLLNNIKYYGKVVSIPGFFTNSLWYGMNKMGKAMTHNIATNLLETLAPISIPGILGTCFVVDLSRRILWEHMHNEQMSFSNAL